MSTETIRYVVMGDGQYYRAVLLLADALLILGVRDQVVPTLVAMFDQALEERSGDGSPHPPRQSSAGRNAPDP